MNTLQHAECYTEVQADIARLEHELDELRSVAKWHLSKSSPSDISTDDSSIGPKRERLQRNLLKGPYTNMKQIKAAEDVLHAAAGEPLNTKVIAEKLIEGGYAAKSLKKLIGSLFTGMTRRPNTFAKAGPGMWKLIETNTNAT